MRRGRLLGMGVLVLVAAAVTVMGQPASASAPAEADFVVHSGSAHGKVGEEVSMTGWYHNNGPSDAITGMVTLEMKLPGGARFIRDAPANCVEIVPRRHVTCRNPGFWPSGYTSPRSFIVKIVSTDTTAGFMSVSYAGDPKPGNNRAALTLSIDGMVKPKPTPTTAPATTKAAPKPTTAKPTPTRSATASVAPLPSPTPSPSADVVAAIEPSPAGAASQSPTATLLVAVGGGLLVALGVFAVAFTLHRRARRGEPDTR
jgi:hypothetical protein